jgi:ubiquinone/menaquinone biosynthesis C-methylase UbiE
MSELNLSHVHLGRPRDAQARRGGPGGNDVTHQHEPTSGSGKQDISQRFTRRSQAERYRDRFSRGRHLRAHEREVAALRSLLSKLCELDTVLDVASGAGRFTPVFTSYARAVVQVDASSQMLSVSRESYDYPQNLGYVQADARTLAFAADCADFVFCHRLLNHLPKQRDRLQIMAELGRVSRRFVTVSCLTPPAPLRALRRLYARLRGRSPMDSFVETAELLRDAEHAGLRLTG